MKMSSAAAFGYAASGSMNEKVASIYNDQMNRIYSNYANLGGWLGEALEVTKKEHDYFMRSRLWEFGKMLKGGEGKFVGRYEIGYLGGLDYQRSAEGFMRDIIMANPNLSTLYQEGRVDGYGGELSHLNFGNKRENYFYNKVNDGYLLRDEEEGLSHTRFLSTRDNMVSYSARERHDSQRTWRASNSHLANGYDPTCSTFSDGNGKVLSVEEGLAKLKQLNEKKEDK